MLCCIAQVVSSMEELYKFMNHSNATLDLKVGNELATEPLPEGEAAEVCPKPYLPWSALLTAGLPVQLCSSIVSLR